MKGAKNVVKEKILKNIDNNREEILQLSHSICSNPELAFSEKKAVGWQKDILHKYGFKVKQPYCGLDTAYRASKKGYSPGPRIAILAEYDALPEIGHGCGHNIIAASAVGAAIGLLAVIEDIPGEIIVMGTPGEEGGGGKIVMVDNGAFDDIDYAMMIHPSSVNMVGRGGLASTGISVEYIGKPAHSAGPQFGINALDTMISLFNNIKTCQQKWNSETKINGIIKNGGTASNIIPDYVSAEFTLRAKTQDYLKIVLKDVKKAIKAAALVTGAKYKYNIGLIYAERHPNLTMGEVFKANMEALGEKVVYPRKDEVLGSSDIGNVSLKVPTIHEYIAITPKLMNSHTREFAKVAASKKADHMLIKGAKALAMTAYDILTDKKLQKAICDEFETKVKPFCKES